MEKEELIRKLEQAPGKTLWKTVILRLRAHQAGNRRRNDCHCQETRRREIPGVRGALLRTGNQTLREGN